MGRPRKIRPPPRPVGRPRKVLTAADKLAALSASERAQLAQYNEEIHKPKNGRLKQGDVRADGKVFLWYKALWVSPAAFKRYKARMKAWYKKKSMSAGADKPKSNNNPDQNQQDTHIETPGKSDKPE